MFYGICLYQFTKQFALTLVPPKDTPGVIPPFAPPGIQ